MQIAKRAALLTMALGAFAWADQTITCRINYSAEPTKTCEQGLAGMQWKSPGNAVAFDVIPSASGGFKKVNVSDAVRLTQDHGTAALAFEDAMENPLGTPPGPYFSTISETTNHTTWTFSKFLVSVSTGMVVAKATFTLVDAETGGTDKGHPNQGALWTVVVHNLPPAPVHSAGVGAVPEPGAFSLMGIGLGLLAAGIRRFRKV